jgi:hypothetical protein
LTARCPAPGAVLAAVLSLSACTPPKASTLRAGDAVPAFTTVNVAGQPFRVAFPENRRTVLLVFLASCSTCQAQLPLWKEAFARRPEGTDVVGVLVDQEPPGYWDGHAVPFDVVRAPGREFMREQYRLRHAPSTLRIGPNGRVEDLAVGAAPGRRIQEIFGIAQPS